jgi:hypothetical protein
MRHFKAGIFVKLDQVTSFTDDRYFQGSMVNSLKNFLQFPDEHFPRSGSTPFFIHVQLAYLKYHTPMMQHGLTMTTDKTRRHIIFIDRHEINIPHVTDAHAVIDLKSRKIKQKFLFRAEKLIDLFCIVIFRGSYLHRHLHQVTDFSLLHKYEGRKNRKPIAKGLFSENVFMRSGLGSVIRFSQGLRGFFMMPVFGYPLTVAGEYNQPLRGARPEKWDGRGPGLTVMGK